jgi:hypothetical protein
MSRVKLLGVVVGLLLVAGALYAEAPPIIPSNACEAQCLADFRMCEAQCRQVFCLVPCDLLFRACLTNNCSTG